MSETNFKLNKEALCNIAKTAIESGEWDEHSKETLKDMPKYAGLIAAILEINDNQEEGESCR